MIFSEYEKFIGTVSISVHIIHETQSTIVQAPQYADWAAIPNAAAAAATYRRQTACYLLVVARRQSGSSPHCSSS